MKFSPQLQFSFSFKLILAVLSIALSATRNSVPDTDWTEYNGGADKNHFSPLTQINTENVARLKPAWVYASGGADTVKNTTQMQCNPIIVRGILYGVSAGSQAFALNAATGKEI